MDMAGKCRRHVQGRQRRRGAHARIRTGALLSAGMLAGAFCALGQGTACAEEPDVTGAAGVVPVGEEEVFTLEGALSADTVMRSDPGEARTA